MDFRNVIRFCNRLLTLLLALIIYLAMAITLYNGVRVERLVNEVNAMTKNVRHLGPNQIAKHYDQIIDPIVEKRFHDIKMDMKEKLRKPCSEGCPPEPIVGCAVVMKERAKLTGDEKRKVGGDY